MGYPKALLKIDGETFVDRLVRTFSNQCSPVLVVLGAHVEQIRAGVRSAGAQIVVNSRYREGQITSLQCGLQTLPQGIGGVLFTLVDHPNVAPRTIAALLAETLPKLRIPRYEGRRGHPIFFAGGLIAEFLAVPPASSARE